MKKYRGDGENVTSDEMVVANEAVTQGSLEERIKQKRNAIYALRYIRALSSVTWKEANTGQDAAVEIAGVKITDELAFNEAKAVAIEAKKVELSEILEDLQMTEEQVVEQARELTINEYSTKLEGYLDFRRRTHWGNPQYASSNELLIETEHYKSATRELKLWGLSWSDISAHNRYTRGERFSQEKSKVQDKLLEESYDLELEGNKQYYLYECIDRRNTGLHYKSDVQRAWDEHNYEVMGPKWFEHKTKLALAKLQFEGFGYSRKQEVALFERKLTRSLQIFQDAVVERIGTFPYRSIFETRMYLHYLRDRSKGDFLKWLGQFQEVLGDRRFSGREMSIAQLINPEVEFTEPLPQSFGNPSFRITDIKDR